MKLANLFVNELKGEFRRRGVAQLIARSVWDREVEGLSPFTPTTLKR